MHVYKLQYSTNNVTGRHRGPKQKLRAGYTKSDVLCVVVECKWCYIFHCRVWYCALPLHLDLSNNWQTSHWEHHTNEKEEMLLAMFRLHVGLERLVLLTVSSCRLFHSGIVFTKNECLNMGVCWNKNVISYDYSKVVYNLVQ